MAKYALPRSYAEAIAEALHPAHDYHTSGITIRPAIGNPTLSVSLVNADGVAFVTFFHDGRVKVLSFGRNDYGMMARINAALPRPYRVRQSGNHHLALIDSRRASPVAIFLSSTVFTPKPYTPAASGRGAA